MLKTINKNSKYFITFEGGEGSGKSTQIELLANFLKNNGFKCYVTREPGGLKISEEIREILLKPRKKSFEGVNILTETFLYLAARAQFYDHVILPRIKKENIIICDRSYDSTMAYQGYARGVDLDLIETLNKAATQNCIPDVTILLDIEPKIGIKRVKGRGQMDRIDSESLNFHKKVRNGYLRIAKSEPNRFIIINANQGIDEIHEAIKSKLFPVNLGLRIL